MTRATRTALRDSELKERTREFWVLPTLEIKHVYDIITPFIAWNTIELIMCFSGSFFFFSSLFDQSYLLDFLSEKVNSWNKGK